MSSKSILHSFLLVAGSSLLAISSATAQSWDGDTNNGWLDSNNWTGGVAAGSGTSTDTDIAVFNVNVNNTIEINMTPISGLWYLGAIDNTNANTRVIRNTNATTGVLTLNGATVNSVANTIIRNSTSALLTIGNNTTGTLGLGLGNATTNVIQITSSGGITINSIISGSNGITRQGNGGGILTLTGNNSYNGVTAINVGVISISNNNALGTTGSGNNTTIAATGSLTTGGHLQLSGGINSSENITITGGTESSGFNGAIRNTSGNNTLSGNIILSSLTSGVRLDTAGGNLTLSGNISQTGSTQSFSLAPTTSSTITVDNAIVNNGGVFQTLSSGVGGVGTVILKGVNATDGTGIGATNVAQNSTLQLGVTNALNTTANLNIAAFGGADQGTFNLNGFDQTINALTSNASGANRIVRNNSATTASILTVGNGGGTGSFNGTIVNGAAATLALVKTGAGNQTLSGINTYTGGTRIDEGTLTLGHATDTLANGGAVNVNGGTLAIGTNNDTVGAVTLTSGNITGSGTGTLTGTGSAYDARSGSVSARLGGSVGLTKSTTGTVTLAGTNSYSGATAVNAGTLEVNGTGSINTTSSINIASGGTLRYNSSTALTVAPTLNGAGVGSRAVLGGSGLINASITLNNLGDVLSPGNSPGIQSYTPAQTWASFSYDWEVNNFTGTTAGTDFDQLSLTSTLDLTGGSGSYILNVLGLTAGNISGLVPNFSEIDRTWTILTSSGISNFNAANWTINTTGFTDPDTGTWALTQSGNNLVLSYTVIPEPSVALLGGLGLLALLRRRRN